MSKALGTSSHLSHFASTYVIFMYTLPSFSVQLLHHVLGLLDSTRADENHQGVSVEGPRTSDV